MFESYKGREVKEGQNVEVYKNLHNGKWSIRDSKSKLVLGHADTLKLRNATFIVRESGRQRVLREKQKNIHAFIKGELVGLSCNLDEASKHEYIGVTYNPYLMVSFQTKDNTKLEVKKASHVILTNEFVFANL